jgi:hypothetical protein
VEAQTKRCGGVQYTVYGNSENDSWELRQLDRGRSEMSTREFRKYDFGAQTIKYGLFNAFI